MGSSRWRSALAVLVIVLAAACPLWLLHPWVTQNFRIGSALLSVKDVDAGPVGRFGPVVVNAKHYYQLALEGTGTAGFKLYLDYQDGSASKKYDPPPPFDESAVILRPNTQASHDDPAATVVVESTNPARTLQIRRLEVYEVSPRFYVWRVLVRGGSCLVTLAGLMWLGWRYYRRGYDQYRVGLDEDAHRLRVYAAVLLVAASGCAVYFIQSHHGQLARQPPYPSITGWDGSFYYFWLRSAMVEGDFDFTKDLRYCGSMLPATREKILRETPRTKTGLFPNRYPIGWALFEVPWYVAADLTARAVNALGGNVPRDGWQPLYQAFLVAGQLVYAVGGLWFAYRILAESLPSTAALSGVALGWMCSPLSYYQIIGVDMSHNIMFFAVAAAYFFARRLRDAPDRARNWILVGLTCAMAILARYQGVVMLLYPGVICLQAVFTDARRWRLLVLGVAVSAVPLTLQALAWKIVYGSYIVYTYDEGFDWTHPHLYQALFSPYHGLFNWHPALLVGFVGFIAWAVVTPRRTEAICFGAALLLTTYVNAAWSCWWFGDSFGSRAFEACTLFTMLGFGWLLQVFSGRAVAFRLTATGLFLAAMWNMNFMLLAHDGPLALSRPVPWSEKITLTRRYWGTLF